MGDTWTSSVSGSWVTLQGALRATSWGTSPTCSFQCLVSRQQEAARVHASNPRWCSQRGTTRSWAMPEKNQRSQLCQAPARDVLLPWTPWVISSAQTFVTLGLTLAASSKLRRTTELGLRTCL